MILFTVIVLSVFFAYLTIGFGLIHYWRKTPVYSIPEHFQPKTKISIILPARNEEQNIKECLESLTHQDYPHELLEIIVVDDQSFDSTNEILSDYKNPLVRYMRLGVEGMTTIEGSKKKAIAYGISHAKGDLMITTDADCIHHVDWIKTISAFYESTNAKLIIGAVLGKEGKGIFNWFQQLDLINTFLIHAAGIKSGKYYLCSGANLAYPKSVFIEADPYNKNMHIASGDDVFLIQKIKSLYPKDIYALKSKSAVVKTNVCKNWKEMVLQRLRWAQKTRKVGSWATLLLATIVWLQRLLPLMYFIVAMLIQDKNLIILSISIMIITSVTNFIILLESCNFFLLKKKLVRYFIPSEWIYTMYYLWIGIISWFPASLEWKDRRI